MKLTIEVQTLTPAQMESLETALPTNDQVTGISLEWHIPGDYYSLPVASIEAP